MFKVERILRIASVKRVVVYASDNEPSGQLSGEKTFLRRIQITSGYGECFTNCSSYRKFHVSTFESFRVCQKHRRTQFNFSDVQFTFQNSNFIRSTRNARHQTE